MANATAVSVISRLVARSLPSLHIQVHTRIVYKRSFCAATSLRRSQASSETTTDNEGKSAAPDTETSANETESTESDETTKQIEGLQRDLADMKDKYQRALADRENVRMRLEKQVVDAKRYGIQGFCKDLLEVSDVFHKALQSVPPEQLAAGTEDLKTLYNGLSMTETQMLSVFRRHGLSSMPLEVGARFDTSWQEAMFEIAPTEGQQPGTVAHILRDAWKLHERCIRSAQVGVVKE